MEGYLIKRGHRVKSWKKRYFILDAPNGELRYYKKQGILAGLVKLTEDCVVVPDDTPWAGEGKFCFALQSSVDDDKKQKIHAFLLCAAASDEERQDWIDKILVVARKGSVMEDVGYVEPEGDSSGAPRDATPEIEVKQEEEEDKPLIVAF